MPVTFAERTELLKASEIREILKITQRPEVISFAGGLPAPELFPVEEMKDIAVKVLEESGSQALQYSTTEGFDPLRQQIAVRMNAKFKTDVGATNILITCGSQQALDFSGKLFLNPGDVVLCESPTYLAAISAFKAYQPRFVEVPTDDNGMIIPELEKILQTNENIKLIYLIPDFQNPTGRTWSLERRQQFIQLINRYEIPAIEDNPYGELRFEGEILPAIKSMDTKDLVIFVSTFSKTFCPGLRIGWVAAGARFIEKYILIKQGADLHTSSISQRIISRYMEIYDFEAHIKSITDVYRRRRDAMIHTMQENFAGDVRFTRPQGGLFTWVKMPPYIKAVELLKQCLRQEVAFVPGDSFFPNGQVENTFRLNYSNMPEERIAEGIKRLAAVMRKY
ncbi:aminotransferase class i/classii [Lucifera butyrica]|uniref:Aminotransferase class i/classii n=1 Tax=Lucifera butyrica TaxID=1351585 RepID=A0A498R660_9FIRM|nr:PLP-dependent aminotransferase family protein [Lucifera butyrica]VBB06954.1 aminotransferase class i/classii [Lucifera butyrica]